MASFARGAFHAPVRLSDIDCAEDGVNILAAGGGRCWVWSSETGDIVEERKSPTVSSADVRLSCPPAGIYSTKSSDHVLFWDGASWSPVGESHRQNANRFQVSSDGCTAVVDNSWHDFTASKRQNFPARIKEYGSLSMSLDGSAVFAVGREQNLLHRWVPGQLFQGVPLPSTQIVPDHLGKMSGVVAVTDKQALSISESGALLWVDFEDQTIVETGFPPVLWSHPNLLPPRLSWDGSLLAYPSGSRGQRLVLVDTASRSVVRIVEDSPAKPVQVAFARDKRWVACATRVGVVLFDPSTGRRLGGYAGHGAPVRDFLWTGPDGRLGSVAGDEPQLRSWDPVEPGASDSVELPVPTTGVVQHPDGLTLALTQQDGSLTVFSVSDGRVLAASPVPCAASSFSRDGTLLFIASPPIKRSSFDHENPVPVSAWDVNAQQTVWTREVRLSMLDTITILTSSRDDHVWIVGKGDLVVLDGQDGHVVWSSEMPAASCDRAVCDSAACVEGGVLLSCTQFTYEGSMDSILSAPTERSESCLLRMITGNPIPVWSVDSFAGRIMPSPGQSWFVHTHQSACHFRSLATGALLDRIKLTERIEAASLSPDGSRLALGTSSGAIHVYKLDGARLDRAASEIPDRHG